MRTQFPLFQSHLDLTKLLWKKLIKPGDIVIDATCGNGKDALFLASLLIPFGVIHAFDIQKEALQKAKNLFQSIDSKELEIHFYHQSNSLFPQQLKENKVKAVIYNLGYLPGGNKEITTQTNETLKSVQEGLSLLTKEGFISITCYSGHLEGKKEEEALVNFCSTLDPKKWNVTYHRFINRKAAPSLIFIQNSSH